ncbi:MAG: 3-hydroxyacyl-ACP dehydratase FabZ [Clostridiales bacterium]|nr:3-hydroxyacyl-ACP dehydratase FabZ [Clostridiales bacterium]
MNKEEIKQIIPHREPMLLVDEAQVTGEFTGHGKKTITGDEWFVQGHFPGNPVVPGVILCEMMAQASAVIVAEKTKGCTPYFASIKNARFKNKVFPGDTVEFDCELTRSKGAFYFVQGKGYVNGNLCVSAEFSFALIKGVE